MAETIRTLTAMLALMPTGTVGGVSAQDQRDVAYNSMGVVAINAKTSAYTLTEDDVFVSVDATSGAVNMTLPSGASTRAGKIYIIQKNDASGNAVGVIRAGSDTVNGSSSAKTTTTRYNMLLVIGTGTTAWWAVTLSV